MTDRGDVDAIAADVNRVTSGLPFKVRVDREDRGVVELHIDEKAVFEPVSTTQPTSAAGGIAADPTSLPPVPGAAAPAPTHPGSGPGAAVTQPSPSSTWALPPGSTSLPSGPPATQGRNFALIVGVDRFESADALHGSVDALRLATTLKQHCGYPDNRVVLLTQGYRESLGEPTGANIARALKAIAAEATPDDTILVSFSTHGVVVGNETMICPSDEKTGGLVSAADVRTILARSKARVLLLDACQSAGRLDKDSTSPGALAQAAHRENTGLITVAGCRADQFSIETSETGGLFTYFLCQGLAGDADRWAKGNRNGQIDLHELYIYTHDKVAEAADNLRTPARQNPTKLGIETGEILLVR